MIEEQKKESAEQKDFKESFEAVIKPVVDWLNLKPDNERSAKLTFCYANVELSQGAVGTYTFDSSTLKRH